MQMKFSDIEKQDLLKAWLAITIAFSIVKADNPMQFAQPSILITSALTVGVGFLLHELGHKFMAQRYGMWAEFRADDMMLLFAIILSFTGFIFAAPGAVMIAGYGSRDQAGKIALAGPVVNIILSLLFLLGLLTLRLPLLLIPLFSFGYSINAWLALFNLLPFGPLDGAKIKNWNPSIWLATFIAGIALSFVIPSIF